MVQPVIKSVIFDLDGVLVRRDLESPLRLTAGRADVSVDDLRAEYDRLGLVLAGYGNESIPECARVELALKGLGASAWARPCDKGISLGSVLNYLPTSYPIEEVREIVYSLDSRGYNVGMFTDAAPEITQTEYSAFSVFGGYSTNTPPVNTDSYERHWDSRFPIVISSPVDEPVTEEDFIGGLKNYQLKSAETLFVGDDPQDIQTATRAGMSALLFKNPSQLKEDLSKILGIKLGEVRWCPKKRYDDVIEVVLHEPGWSGRIRPPCAGFDTVIHFLYKPGAGYAAHIVSSDPFYINDHYVGGGDHYNFTSRVYRTHLDYEPMLRSGKTNFLIILKATREGQSFSFYTLRKA